jgi:hypothetical protein
MLQLGLRASFIIKITHRRQALRKNQRCRYHPIPSRNPNIKYEPHDSDKGQINEYQRRDT